MNGERGFFSMTELMMSAGISMMIAAALFTAMRAGSDQLDTAQLRMTIQDSAREGLYKMLQEIRESAPSRIVIAAGGNSIQFNVPDPDNPVLTGAGSNYNVNWPGHTITYALGGPNNTQIIRTNVTLGQTSVIANDVTAVNFAGNAGQPTVVTVSMSVQRTLPNNRVVPAAPAQITGQARVRNT